MRGAWAGLVLGAALAAAPAHAWDHGGVEEAARMQVAAYLDLGEVGLALALTRRGTRKLPDSVGWHILRLDALAAAGMSTWVDDDYARRLQPGVRASPEALAWAAWATARGEDVAVDAFMGADVPAMVAARGRRALDAGDLETVLSVAEALGGVEGTALRLQALARQGARDAMVEEALAWLDDSRPLRPLAALWDLPSKGPVKRARKTVLKAIDAVIGGAGGPAAVLDAHVVARAAGDTERQAALATRASELSAGDDLQTLFDALSDGPEHWRVWELAPRPRYNQVMLSSVGEMLARTAGDGLPWMRRDERAVAVAAWTDALRRRGQDAAADVVADRFGEPCTPHRRAELLLAQGRAREARQGAEDALFGCVGMLDLVPAGDPARLDVASWYTTVGRSWAQFARAAHAGQWSEAPVAAAVAARLWPTEETVRLAQALARGGDLPVERTTGLPTVAGLVVAVQEAPWLVPAGAVASTRARKTRAWTLALLTGEARWLAEAATALNACMPTMRVRCKVEHAATVEAARRQQAPLPEGIEVTKDPAVARAGAQWVDARDAAWFANRAEVARLAGTARRDLDEVLRGGAVRVGMPAPPWTAGHWSGETMKGQVAVISFWAGWCRPCLAEWPVLDGLAAAWGAQDVPVTALAINVDTTEEAYRTALASLSNQGLDVVHAPDARKAFGVETLPTIVVIDPRGIVAEVRVGAGPLHDLDALVRALAAR